MPNPSVAADIATAAAQVERSLVTNELDLSPSSDYPQIPKPIDGNGDSSEVEEVVEVVDSWPYEEVEGHEDGIYEGASRGVVEEGIEYLAFYKSFRDVTRSPAVNRWGIFFIKRHCLALGKDISYSTQHSFADCMDALTAFLYMHELYHYRFDAHCLQMEATGGSPVYRPYRKLVKSRPISEWHEESVANFYGLNALKPTRYFSYAQPIRDYLWDLVACSPGAYAGGIDKNQISRKDLMTEQAAQSFLGSTPPARNNLITSTLRLGTNMTKSREPSLSGLMHLSHCPVYWIDWVCGGKSVVVPHVASVDEVNNDFIKRYLGGVFDHHSDHSYYRIDNGETVRLPNPHGSDLKHSEFNNILAKAGMTGPQFYKERQRTSVWRKAVPRKPPLPARTNPRDTNRPIR